MNERPWRRSAVVAIASIVAIVKADFLIRFRRLSTLVVFLLLSFFAYLWVPDPSTGQALLVVDRGRRALYDSAAVGLATAMLAVLFVGLVGFYVISNTIGRDVTSRCGLIIAATTVRSGEYLIGKLVGHIVFLVTFTAGFMASSMVMLVVRGEAALQPWLFVKQYLLLLPPAIVGVAVLAVLFESVTWLSGRLGDVAYFVLWTASLGAVVGLLVSGQDPGPARYLDVSGLGFVFEQMRPAMQIPNLSLGGSFDPAQPLFVVPGLRLDRAWILPRIGALLAPLPLLAIALRSFHRFDPARVRSGDKARRGWIARANLALKPLTRILFRWGRSRPSQPSLLHAARTDAALTITAYPVMLLTAFGLAVATAASPASGFLHGVLPMAFGAVGLAIAEVPCRERRAGTLGLIESAPLLKAGFVRWKLLATAAVALAFLAVPLVRMTVTLPRALPAFLIGMAFVVALSTALGVISGNPRAFVAVFLIFWYAVINDGGHLPALDFAGFYGAATPLVTSTYAAIAVTSLAVAQAVYTVRLRRES